MELVRHVLAVSLLLRPSRYQETMMRAYELGRAAERKANYTSVAETVLGMNRQQRRQLAKHLKVGNAERRHTG